MAVTAEAQISEYEMSIQTTRLEKEYEKVLADSSRLLDTERDRVRRMEHLLLQFERDSLRSQLDQANEQLHEATQSEQETRMQLEEALEEIDHLDADVQSSSNEINRLRSELSTSNATSTDHSSLRAEKSRLNRELSSLQAELDRLRNQDSSYQTLVSEKQDLERQINSLEVQLENEKISHERTRAKGSQGTAETKKLSARIEALEADLAKELRAKQQSDHDTRQQNVELENQKSVLEGKIETLKRQLRNAKDKLHEAQQELQQRRSMTKPGIETSEPRSRTVPLQRPGPEADYQSGVTISTPGAVRVQDKLKRQSALPGDKSAFSITPYLNRTKTAKDSSPMSSDVDQPQPKKASADPKPVSRKTSAEKPLDERASAEGRDASSKTTLSKTAKGKAKAQEMKPPSRPAPKIPFEDEEDDDLGPLQDQAQAKIKRRKLGAQRERSLFEEDDDEGGFEMRKPARKVGLGGAAGRTSILATQPPSGIPRNLGFGAPMGFSPLKKDRKRF